MADREDERQAQEKVRQRQEAGRERNERLSRDSRVAAETGRVDAETGRVEAEVERRAAFEMPVWVPQTKKSALLAAVALVITVSIPASYIAFAVADDRAQSRAATNRAIIEHQTRYELRSCEDKKNDRVDNARAWTQAQKAWLARSQDPALSAEERSIAARTAVVYGESANQLRSRLYLCEPYVRYGEKKIDQSALLEAKGEL